MNGGEAVNTRVGRRMAGALAAIAVASLLFVGVAGASAATVKVKDYSFSPGTVKISKGGKVTWKFVEGIHNVTGPGFSSPVQSSGSYSHKFKKAGTYKYHCTLHPGMNGKVKVG